MYRDGELKRSKPKVSFLEKQQKEYSQRIIQRGQATFE